MFDYFYGNEHESYLHIQVPLLLIKAPEFKPLSGDAKLLYGLLLNRTSLSIRNDWCDEQGRVYIIYTIDEIMEDLNCATQKACKLVKDLEKIGLIEVVRRGLNKPNLIYVKNYTTTLKYRKNDTKKLENSGNSRTFENQNSRGCENQNAGILKIKTQDLQKSKSSYIDSRDIDPIEKDSREIDSKSFALRDTNPIYINQSYLISSNQNNGEEKTEQQKTDIIRYEEIPNQSVETTRKEKDEKKEGFENAIADQSDLQISKPNTIKFNVSEIKAKVKTQIDYNFLIEEKRADKKILDEIVYVIVNTICDEHRDGFIIMGNERVAAQKVKDVFLELTDDDIEYFIDCYTKQTKPIIKMTQYIRKSLYANHGTIHHHIENQVLVNNPYLSNWEGKGKKKA